jgi:hypothetical protein
MRRALLVSTALLGALALTIPAALAGVSPKVRVVHASPDAPAVDILVNDEIRAFEDVVFGDITGYAELDAGVYNVKVVPAGGGPDDAVIDADLNLLYYTNYTVLAVNTLDNIEPAVFADSTQDVNQIPLIGKARVRFFHASPDAPAVDVRVMGGPYLFENVPFKNENGQATDYLFVPDVTVDLEVLVAGTDTVVLTVPAVMLEQGKSYTAYAVGFAGGEEPELGALLSEDAGREFPIKIRLGGGDDDDDDDDSARESALRNVLEKLEGKLPPRRGGRF